MLVYGFMINALLELQYCGIVAQMYFLSLQSNTFAISE